EVVDLGGLSILVSLLADCNDHQMRDQSGVQELVKQVLSTLRAIAGNDDVKDAIVHAGGTESIVAAMTQHLTSPQKQACMLIRNLVAHGQAFSKPILDLGAEALIMQARSAHRDCEDVAKAALRDLGCHVELRELWTGQRGNLAP
ncbi:ARMC6 isoform 7, partial [Pan troglodytes]